MNRELKVKTKAGNALATTELQRAFRERRIRSSQSDSSKLEPTIESELGSRLKGS